MPTPAPEADGPLALVGRDLASPDARINARAAEQRRRWRRDAEGLLRDWFARQMDQDVLTQCAADLAS